MVVCISNFPLFISVPMLWLALLRGHQCLHEYLSMSGLWYVGFYLFHVSLFLRLPVAQVDGLICFPYMCVCMGTHLRVCACVCACACSCMFSQESFASIVLLLLLHDAEEFPRRSAASVLCAWLGQSTMQPVLVPTAHNPERHDYQNVQAVPIDKDSVNEHADMVHWTTADNLGCVALSCDHQLRICSSATDTGKWNHSPLERHCCSRREQHSALINGLKDFDWEVKRTMLRFFSDLLTLCAEDRSGKAMTDILSWMCASGCSSVVVGLTEDCDSAVADAAIAFVSRVNRAASLLATKMEATAGGDDGDDVPLSAGAVDVTSLSNFLKWCLRFESLIVQEKAADHWSHVLTLAGFEPLSFLADIIHGAAMPATNEEDKVIVDCY